MRRQLKKSTEVPTEAPTEAPTPKPSTRSPTILIVEDSAAPSTSAPSTVYPTGFEKTTPPTPTALLAASAAPTPTEMFPIELRTNPPTPTMLFPPSLKTFAPSPTDMGSWEPTAAPTLSAVSGGDDDGGGHVVDTGGDGSPSLGPTWAPTWEPTISFRPTTSSPTGYPTDNASWVNKTGWIDDDYSSSRNSIVSIGRFSINWSETDTIIVSVIFTFCFAAACFWLLCCMYVQPKALLERDGRALDPYIKNRHYTAVKTGEPEGASRYSGAQPVSAHASALTSERSPLIASAARKPAGGSTNTNRALLHALRKEPTGAGGAFDDGESGSDLDGKSDFNI